MNAIELKHKKAQLELPLFFRDEPESADILPFEPVPAWRNEDVMKLKEGILTRSLRILADGRASAANQRDEMAWVMSEANHQFSFDACCRDAGYDPERLRAGIGFIEAQKSRAGRMCRKHGENNVEAM